ncbi:putative trans-sialidase, Group V [Trypanosoma cruzi]|uniref:Trans-sialidase, putative n=2 Tax=Trypanosoma cruzi TaxID=5693 RepID=Q4CT82_TRYCC|nr:trans-sialidase, putative [Trypanosoma cruzi]EAN83485.1 trans-sialidase, putative [Trypanosoma cruzi]PWV20415.1 putative trans-sialidase, Group V [Trypanosoma cruzi]|eukprot:XP_805336.1 trans-sialidase [Trypanosoma cruzi strain CL Brener]
MLSRVAAVRAPRTHNRRRVTVSSGRRREGGESEPRRPNMSRHLFYSGVLLLVVLVCCGSGAAGVAGQSSVPKFKWRGINESGGETVESLGAPSLLKVGSDVFAVAEAQCKKKKDGDVSFTGVASQLLTTETAETQEEVLEKPKVWTQVLEEGASGGQKKKVDVSRPTTVLKGDDIYMLVGVYNRVAAPRQDAKPDAAQLGLLLVKGSVNSGGDTNSKKIDWKDLENPPQGLCGAQLDSWTRLIGSGGSGVKMKDETLVFPVEGTKKAADDAEEGVKTVSLIIQSKDTANWTLSKGMSDGGCSDPSVVEWEEGKLMMMTACAGGPRRVYESGDKGESWTEALGTLSRVWGNNKKGVSGVRSGFITATVGNNGVDNKKVMLVTLPVYAENDNKKGKLHLWLTDNTHIVDIGPVSGDGDDEITASSLLYNSGGNTDEKKEELIALYEKKKGNDVKPSPGMVSVLLTEQLQRVKEVLTTWKEVDGRVSQLCTSLSAQKERTSTDDACSADKITAGLVGFLSGNLSGDTWRDEYLGVNATVNNKAGEAASAVTITDKGVTFQGAWAEWPVGKQGQNQLYHFANYNFTLVATVSIDNVPEEGNTPIPLVGVKMNGDGNNVLLGLLYDSGKKWQVLCGEKTTTELSSGWETGTPQQHVVVLLKNGTQGSVYVDGQRVGNEECALGNGESKEISHFYIGGDGENAANNKDVSVTVTNVLLYNRPWDEAEITALNPNKDPTPPVTPNAQEAGTSSALDGSHLTERGQSMGSSGVNGVSAPTVPSAKTSSGEEGSATQLVSEESSDGSKNVGGGSSPGSDAPVETGDRSTVQGDGSSQTPVGTPAIADAYDPNAEAMGHDGTAVNPGASASSGADGETAEGTDGQEKEEIHAQNGDVNATALSSSLGNVSQGNNTDAGTMHESGLLPSLLLLLGLWGFAAL